MIQHRSILKYYQNTYYPLEQVFRFYRVYEIPANSQNLLCKRQLPEIHPGDYFFNGLLGKHTNRLLFKVNRRKVCFEAAKSHSALRTQRSAP